MALTSPNLAREVVNHKPCSILDAAEELLTAAGRVRTVEGDMRLVPLDQVLSGKRRFELKTLSRR
jgi:hypothetical protein